MPFKGIFKSITREFEMLNLKVTEQFGRGLYAQKTIETGTVVMQCELLVLTADDTVAVNKTDLQYYTFKFNETQDCLVLGLGEIFNHDDAANVHYALVDFEGRKVMQFTANQPIMEGDQLFIDYAADTKVNADAYTVNLVG